MGQKVFSRPGAAAAVKEEETGWKDSLYKFYKSGQQSMRVAVYGCKHDAAMFEELLKEYCLLDPGHALGNAMIDSACLNAPKVSLSARESAVGLWWAEHEPCHNDIILLRRTATCVCQLARHARAIDVWSQ